MAHNGFRKTILRPTRRSSLGWLNGFRDFKFLRLRLKESFDRFNSKFTRRRKEMVNFRRVVTVLAVLTLFTGLAFAQQETCSAQGTASNPLRAEGYTEESGDIVITCVSGVPLAMGTNIPLVNITVFYNTTVTSRLLGSALPLAPAPWGA